MEVKQESTTIPSEVVHIEGVTTTTAPLQPVINTPPEPELSELARVKVSLDHALAEVERLKAALKAQQKVNEHLQSDLNVVRARRDGWKSRFEVADRTVSLQRKELETLQAEKTAQSRRNATTMDVPEIGKYKVLADTARVDGVEGRILFQYPPGYKPVEGASNGVRTVEGKIIDPLAASPLARQVNYDTRLGAWRVYSETMAKELGLTTND